MEKNPFDYRAAYEKIAELVNGRRTVVSAIEQLIEYLQDVQPNPTWSEFLEIDFQEDLERICVWAEKLVTRNPMHEAIGIVWFGIFNPIVRGKATADFYLAGAQSFYSDKDLDEWNWQERYWPRGRYAKSAAMHAIYRIAYQENSLQNVAEYSLCLGFTALAAKHLCKSYPDLFAARDTDRAVAVGFDSGDELFVGTVAKKGGWKRYDPSKFLAPLTSDFNDIHLFEVRDVRDGNWWLDSLDDVPGSFGTRCKKEKATAVATRLYEPGRKTDFSLCLLGEIVVTASLARFLRKYAPGDFQSIPVKIQGQRGKFELINVLSNLTWKSLRAWSKTNAKPVSHAPVDIQIMRIEASSRRLVVSKSLKEELEKQGVSGIAFTPLPEPNSWEK